MRTIFLSGLIAGLIGLSLSSCKKENFPLNRGAVVFPSTPPQKEKAKLHQEFARILQKIYSNEQAFREVQATIWTEYYEDERVSLKDLLNPANSPLYQLPAFKAFETGAGHFKTEFNRWLNSGEFPLLSKHVQSSLYTYSARKFLPDGSPLNTGSVSKLQPNSSSPHTPSDNGLHSSSSPYTTSNYRPQPNSSSTVTGPGFDPGTGEPEESVLSIYFPYSANYKPVFEQAEETWLRATLVAADRDADEAPGLEPVNCGYNTCYLQVMVNDDYCESHVVHIAQSGATVAAVPIPGNGPVAVNLVMLGNVRCSHQYDKLISFTNNGGGSEIRFVRADSYLEQNSDGQITSPQNVISVNFSRRDIRRKNWKTVNSIWDSNWETDNPEQVFGIYEEDDEGSRTFSGSIQAKLKIFTIEPLNYSFTVKTKDDIIRQLGWKRNSFFAYNRGGLNNGCGVSNGFTIYDCNTPVSYTLPVQQ